MRKIKYAIELFWLRLKEKTPMFFKYWGAIVAILTAFAALLNGKVLLGTVPSEYLNDIFVYDCVVGFLHIITPYLATKNRALMKDNPIDAVKTYKLEKELLNEDN